jgi:integrase
MKLPTPTKQASGLYCIRLRLGGKSIAVTGYTPAECRREAAVIKAKHISGEAVQRKRDITVGEAIDEYIAKRPKLSPSTVKGYKSIKKNVFAPITEQKLDSVDWQKFIDGDEHSPKTIKNAWGLMVSVLADNDLPVPKIRLPAIILRERPFLQPEQIPTFLKAIHGQRCELAALLGLHSLRRSEILDITYNDIDLKRKVIHVRGAAVIDEHSKLVHKKANKNATSTRDIPIMIARLTELVKEHNGEKTDYLITAYPNSIYKEVNAICEKHNLPQVGVHGLRHSFVSLAYHLGWSELATMQIAGYSDPTTMKKNYTHLANADKNASVNSMSEFFSKNSLAN